MVEEYLLAEVEAIRIFNYNFIVVLSAQESKKVLVICIGPGEAQSIAIPLNGKNFQRPLTHDLMAQFAKKLDVKFTKIEIHDYDNGTYFANLHWEDRSGAQLLDARPSDAIGISLRTDTPIFVAKRLFEEQGVLPEHTLEQGEDNQSEKPNNKLGALRRRLQQAIDEERYEDAALIRDEIEQLVQID